MAKYSAKRAEKQASFALPLFEKNGPSNPHEIYIHT